MEMCIMKTKTSITQVLVFWLSAASVIMVAGRPANADFTFANLENLGPPINTQLVDAGPMASTDGLSLFFGRYTSGSPYPDEMFLTTRPSTQDPWGTPVSLGAWGVNCGLFKYTGVLLGFTTADGLEAYWYFSNKQKPGGYGSNDLYMMKRETIDADWGPFVNMGLVVNSSAGEAAATISPDGLELYFHSGTRPGGHGSYDLWVTKRATRNDPWGIPENLREPINSAYSDLCPRISADGLSLFFCSDRPGGYGSGDLYMLRRRSPSGSWGDPMNLGPLVNSPGYEENGFLLADGSTFLFDSDRGDGYGQSDMWQASVIPVVDFNGDGKVDLVDLVMLIDDWGTNKTLCDIGPMPWGDGKVDIEDLKVFMTYYEKANPPKSQDGQ
jgi:hypothetical protein